MRSAIFIVGILLFVFGSIGSVLVDIHKRRNRRANPTRRRSQRRWEGPYNAGETGGGYDERDQGGDWGGGTWGGSGDWGGGDWGGGGGGGDEGGDSGGRGSD